MFLVLQFIFLSMQSSHSVASHLCVLKFFVVTKTVLPAFLYNISFQTCPHPKAEVSHCHLHCNTAAQLPCLYTLSSMACCTFYIQYPFQLHFIKHYPFTNVKNVLWLILFYNWHHTFVPIIQSLKIYSWTLSTNGLPHDVLSPPELLKSAIQTLKFNSHLQWYFTGLLFNQRTF